MAKKADRTDLFAIAQLSCMQWLALF